jgi:hypothetical protein
MKGRLQFDPSATLAVHCGNGLMPGLSPIYDLVSAGGHPLPLEVILGAMAR